MFITFEGIDQSGKTTQTRLLAENLEKRASHLPGPGRTGGVNGSAGSTASPAVFSFPAYETPIGRLIRDFLDGRCELPPEAMQHLYAANRWEKAGEIRRSLRGQGSGRVVIANRYTGSGLAYGLAQGLDLPWMKALEQGLPEPDVTVLLDLAPSESAVRKQERDRYESRLDFLREVRRAYLQLAEDAGWIVLDAAPDPEAVAGRVWRELSARLPDLERDV